MDGLEFPQQKYIIKLMPRFVGDLEYRQRVNWNSSENEIRERANLMFSRMRNELYQLANGNEVNLTKISGIDYEYIFTDNFAKIRMKALKDSNGNLCYLVEEVEWMFKHKDWWNIILEDRKNRIRLTESQLRSIIGETIRKILYQ